MNAKPDLSAPVASSVLVGIVKRVALVAIFLAVVMAIRTAFEDRMLHARLAGYREYAGQVRYRLVPGIW